ncbi:MAG: dipeptide epimerase [Myxococcales bacterium]|nr:dipeptide epimerase [Myxococcales bacterium]MCB9644557.1 dipeptide epimerase [Myxococcales bacterium]
MKIQRLVFWPLSLKLREPYTISYETIDTAPQVFLQIHTDTGLVGWGACNPDLQVTGETQETVLTSLRDLVEPALIGEDPLRISWVLNKIRPLMNEQPSAKALVDMALYDLLGKRAGLPIYRLLGGYRTSISTSITIGIMPIVEAVEHAVRFTQQGFHCIKVKGGSHLDEDIERVRKIREAIGKGVALRFDANQGYTVEESVRFVHETLDVGIELLEQPTPREKREWLGQVSQRTTIPIMADESLVSLRDAFRLAQEELTDMVNIKLMKVGGLERASQVNAVAYAAGLEAMVGCMDETALGIAAGLHFALARPNVHYADLDGHFDLLDDPSSGTVILRDGVLFPREEAGLGLCWSE